MIRVLVVRADDNTIKMFDVVGHSGYDVHGRDIVCAAVSVTAFTAAGALEELAGVAGSYSEGSGHMRIELKDDVETPKKLVAETIMNTAYIGFKQIEKSYSRYLFVEEKFNKDVK